MAPRKRRVGRSASELLTVAQVAKEVGVHLSTVYRWIQSGNLAGREVNGVKVVSRSALKKFQQTFLE